MIIDLKVFSSLEREDIIRMSGDTLRHIPFSEIHPDRSSSKHYYEIRIEEDFLQRARRERTARQVSVGGPSEKTVVIERRRSLLQRLKHRSLNLLRLQCLAPPVSIVNS